MVLEKTDRATLREEYLLFIQSTGKSKNTANTTASSVFALWNKCGEEYFWKVINSDDASLRGEISSFLETYYPNQLKYLSGYLTSVRYFKSFLAAKTNTVFLTEHPPVQRKQRTYTRDLTQNVLPLTCDMLEEEHKKVLADSGYGSDYRLIESILKRFPKNTDLEHVVLKIALFDMTYSTNIGIQRNKIILEELARIIVDIKDFDDRICQGDPSVVPIIARSNGKINLFSFATKYCTCHAVSVYENDDYVIFDNVVKKILPKYVEGLRESTVERWRQSADYVAYKKCIDDLLDANGIDIPFRHRKLDHYLWHKYRKLLKSSFDS